MKPSMQTELALTNQKLQHVCDCLERLVKENMQWNTEKINISNSLVKDSLRLDLLERENGTQWKRIDWLWRTVWGVVIAQVIMILLLFGAKFIPLIKI